MQCRRPWALVLLLLPAALAGPAAAAVTVDSVSSGAANSDSITISHSVAGSERLLVVGVSSRGTPNPPSATSVTYDGTPLTPGTSFSTNAMGANNATVQFFYMTAPPVGTADVVVSFFSSGSVGAGAISFNGVDQTVPVSGASGGVALSSSVVAGVDDLVLDAVALSVGTQPASPSGG